MHRGRHTWQKRMLLNRNQSRSRRKTNGWDSNLNSMPSRFYSAICATDLLYASIFDSFVREPHYHMDWEMFSLS
uniref:Uncharacterized protein n=1 Tax=Steinernema glaseri TaxID=37863 RepID=A0A1I8AUX2_9BILA